ncbi:MAG TPA: GNAT family N-acetyltransferase [Phototrophicaceae bacterium]|nr:GNAT family N-acetyltransferase [Phototrophicaceae bacterium]
MVEVNIRPANADDADAIADLWAQLVAYHQLLDEDMPGAALNGPKRYARRLVQRVDDSYLRTFVAEVDGRVVGFILGSIVDLMPDIFDQEPGGFLADVFVDPHYRRLGVGRRLVAALTAWFREQNIHYFDWNVAVKNPEGRAFWLAMGGRELMVRMRADLKDEEA